jgi:hypothetical protein
MAKKSKGLWTTLKDKFGTGKKSEVPSKAIEMPMKGKMPTKGKTKC